MMHNRRKFRRQHFSDFFVVFPKSIVASKQKRRGLLSHLDQNSLSTAASSDRKKKKEMRERNSYSLKLEGFRKHPQWHEESERVEKVESTNYDGCNASYSKHTLATLCTASRVEGKRKSRL
jgi:hypothetical protein